MASVTVLVPTGRRQNVKVTPNTTLLQVLEEVCKKQKLNPDEYNIKHFNKILDLSMVFRFSGLPNNAQLELVKATTLREESKVHIALQVGDNMTRVTEDFWPSDSLLYVVQRLAPDTLNTPDKIPVVIFMRKEIIGTDALCGTNLKILGLTKGSAALRLVLRDNDLPPEQKVSGSGVYYRPPPPEVRTQSDISLHQVPAHSESKITLAGNVEAMDCSSSGFQENFQPPTFTNPPQSVPLELTNHSVKKEEGTRIGESEAIMTSQTAQSNTSSTNQEEKQDNTLTAKDSEMDISPTESSDEIIQYIGERNALIFNQADNDFTHEDELPDDFFDLTINDYRLLARDYKRKLRELENIPLQTSAQRELQRSKQVLNRLNYKSTVIRVQFPDRLVLQGVFNPVDTISLVMEFVRKFLQHSDVDFYLYMTPPKIILPPESHLVEVDCVPRALLYFGPTNYDGVSTTYLHSSYLSKLTTSRQASKAALLHARKMNTTDNESLDDSTGSEEKTKQSETTHSSTSSDLPYYSRPSSSKDNQSKQNVNVPKWFKKQ